MNQPFSSEPFDSIVDRIYEAAVIPGMWPGVLQNLNRLTASLGSVLIARSAADLRMVASDDVFAREATEYFTTFSSHNERLVRLTRAAIPGFVSDHDVFTADEIEVEPMFRDFLRPRGYGRGIATVIPMLTGEEIILHCEGRFSPEPFDRRILDMLAQLRPHLARASMLAARTAFQAARTAVETLERVGLPSVAVTGDGAIITANSHFEQEAAHWARGSARRLWLIDPNADRLLAEALQTLHHTNVVRSIPVAREAGPGVLHVIPVRRAAADIFGRSTALVIFMRPRAPQLPAPSLLQALFDLTPTEALIAQQTARGMRPAEIAAGRGTSLETVRNQLKQVLAKTGCRRQADLQAMLTLLGGPAAADRA